MSQPINLFEYEKLAYNLIDKPYLDYFTSGADDEITLGLNRSRYGEILLRPRMLVDVSNRDMEVEIFGDKLSMPIIAAPTAFQCLAHPQGELAVARAMGELGTAMTLSTLATHSIEEVKEASSHHLWFQLYVYKDKEITRDLVRRAKAANYKALVLTVDSPLLGRRERDIRNEFHLPDHLKVRNLEKHMHADIGKVAIKSGLAAYIASLYDTSLTWSDLDWIASLSDLPILVKGILRADDARRAKRHGASGIIVSNHGGRQLDTALPTIEALSEVVHAVPDLPVLIDGGIRRGTDVLKALALGAKAVLVGRPLLWGLAVGGSAGVKQVFSMLADELSLAMALSGVPSIQDITEDLVKMPHHW